MTDPIADMLNRIKNAQAVGKGTVEVPFSKVRFAMAKVLERTGFLAKVELKTKKQKRPIELTLSSKEGVPAVSGVSRVSKPGKRAYAGVSGLRKVAARQGIAIVSTSKGLMTAGEAAKANLGGEVLGEVW